MCLGDMLGGGSSTGNLVTLHGSSPGIRDLRHEKFGAAGWPVGPRALIVFQVPGCTCPFRLTSAHFFPPTPSISMRDKWQKWKIRSFAFDPLGSLLALRFAVRDGSNISGLLSFNLAQKSLLASCGGIHQPQSPPDFYITCKRSVCISMA